jgi:hypothetical protein
MNLFQALYNKRIALIVVSILFVTLTTRSQSTPGLADFVILAGNGGPGTTAPASGQYGVQVGSSITITGGSVGAYSLVQTTGNASIFSNIYSGGWVSITNSNVIGGRITAANPANSFNPALLIGSSTNVSGNIDVNGNIVIGGGTVSGAVTHPTGTTYSGPVPAGGEFIATPSIPVLPAFPGIASFSAAGTTDITSSQSIGPGSYRNVSFSGNKTLTLDGPGTYVFNAISMSGNSNRLVFNFNGQPGNFYIHIHGDADFGKLNASMSAGGSESRIFTEVHGSGQQLRCLRLLLLYPTVHQEEVPNGLGQYGPQMLPSILAQAPAQVHFPAHYSAVHR